jgi:hypothetical protein
MPRATTTVEDCGNSLIRLLDARRPDGGLWQAGPPRGCPTDLQLRSGWRVRHFTEGTGRRVIEIYDVSRERVALVASSMRPLVSIDAAWRGHQVGVSGQSQWWALAIGHAYGESIPLVTFGSRSSGGQVRRVAVTPDIIDGLWLAMVPGRQATVSLCQRPHHPVRGISPTYRGRS